MTNELTTADIYRAYQNLPKIDWSRQQIQWVLSSETCNTIEEIQGGSPLPDGLPRTLFGLPVRIDDNAQGLDHEVVSFP
jgi:hypothetical protein